MLSVLIRSIALLEVLPPPHFGDFLSVDSGTTIQGGFDPSNFNFG